ncbi:MAG: hypothetical protein IPJ48_19995 [Propionivibrio sp.]|uniref:Kelch repeat-containing protein n=1 Tax=Candidatus Propionivibrio dominans TaxID=2954373 RepID=A0A9D7FF31_9RHOO|nr:hypothetical protein [Candidatus Propionivibrio dominans]MBL0168978.1 hypothetical protein [Propionivibrio sp.]
MPIDPIRKRLGSIAKISGKRRLTAWERLLLGKDVITYALGDLTWMATPQMSWPRWGVDAFVLQNKIWVVGGYHQDGSIADIEVFDTATRLWTSIPYPFTYFGQAFVTTSNGLLYAIGGLESCQSLVSPVEEYNPVTGLVTQKAAIPTPCYNPGIASTSNGKIYVMGGCQPPISNPGGPPSAVLDTVQIFNPQTNTWSVGTPLPSPRHQASAVAAPDGKIYVMGGFDGHAEFNRVDVYTPQTNSWQAATPMPTARRCFASALASNGKIYAIGGLNGASSLTTVEAFTPASNAWKSCAPLAAGRWYLGVAAFGAKLYACGGFMRSGNYQPDNANVSALAIVEEGTIQ